ncbi:MAG: glycosyltransferase [Burkholderiaceae bacterium]
METEQRVAGATLLLMKSSFREALGWFELEGLRRLGITRLMMSHPYRDDGSVLSISMKPAGGWRERLDLLATMRHAIGRRVLRCAWPERGLMWIAGPTNAVPADEREMSDRFALFEGFRQLPPFPVSHASIRRSGGGRYSIWGNHVFLSSTRHVRRPRLVWMVPSNRSTHERLPFVSEVVAPSKPGDRRSFLEELKDRIAIDDARSRTPTLKPGDRVVVLTHALPPGGAERQWCYLAGELQKMGYDVRFVALSPLEGENRHYLPLLAREGVEVTQFDHNVDERGLAEALRSTLDGLKSGDLATRVENPFGTNLRALADLFARLKPRVVFAQLDQTNLIAGVAGVLAAVPQIVLSFRNYNPTRFSYLTNNWFQPLYAALAQSPRISLTGNSRASNADYAQWIGVAERRVKLVPNAIDAVQIGGKDPNSVERLRKNLGVSSSTPIILGVFRLSEEKRPILFIETFAAVAAVVSDTRGFVAGVGQFAEQMQRRIDELGLHDSLTLLGRRDDVPELMQISALLLLTSSFEGMPNVVMEAQAMGLPVVASNVGGVPDCMVDGETGYLVDVDNIPGFARRCVELLKDDQLRTRFGVKGAAYMRSVFSRRAMAERYLQVLQDESSMPSEEPHTVRASAV